MPSARRRAWNDATLSVKVMTLVSLAAVGGVGLGMAEVYLGHLVWPMTVGLSVLLGTIAALARPWIWEPMERLLVAWRRCKQDRGPGALHGLPISRQDEVGQVARALYQLSLDAIRDSYEARQLRRTLDHRIALATRQATAQLRKLAMRDPLTDLGNRRFLEHSLEPLVRSVKASGRTLAAVMIDLDRFKKLNDTMGHAAGDELLVALAGLLRANIRGEDLAIRWGGDEFLLLLPDCPRPRVLQLTQRLRTLFRQHARTQTAGIDVDLSMGAAYLPDDGIESGEELISCADANLYDAKRNGRGRIIGA